MAYSYRLGLVTWGYQVRNPVRPDICHRAYIVYSAVYGTAVYGTVHYKDALKSFKKRVKHNPNFGILSVAVLP